MKIKGQKGITLVILVITIIVLAVITTVSVSFSTEAIKKSKLYAFSTELEMIQQKMIIVNKEIQLGSTAYESIGTKYDELDSEKKSHVQQVLMQNELDDYSNYTYMSKEDLLKIGLKNTEQDVIICYGKNIVYSYTGIKVEGKFYYSLNEISKI